MTDVIVVGAGPTGLLLAGDLAEAGVSVTVLERRGGDVSNLSRAFGVHARTLEVLDARGLADALTGTAVSKVRRARLFGRVRVDFGRLPSRFPYLLVTPQYEVERVLRERAVAVGAEFVYDATVVDVRQDATGVEVDTRGPDGATATRRAAYVVGADGFHSAVRKSTGQPFPGKSVIKSIMLADVRLTETPPEALTVNGRGDAFAFLAPFGDGFWRVFTWDRHREVADDAPLDLAEIREATRQALGSDYGMHDPRWMSRFHSDERQVPEYRVGPVLLAGDAAHVHSPAGGLGMNTGLQDAANLGWKLVAVLHGAPESLLDTYHAERHPVGAEVVAISGRVIRLAMLKSRVGRVLRGVVGGLAVRVPPIRRAILGRLSGIGFAYAAPRGGRRPVGTRMPDVDLADGTRLYEALRGGRFVLVEGRPGTARVDGWPDRVRVAASARPSDRSLLVRPDGYVAATYDGPIDAAALRDTLTGLAGKE